MSDDPVIELADLVTQSLNAASLGFTAERAYLPVLKRKSLATDYRVFVIPKSETSQPHTRAIYDQTDWEIWIGILKKLTTFTDGKWDDAELDACRAIVRAAKDHLRSHNKLGNYTRIKTANDPLFDPEHLEDAGQFTSILTVTYRAIEG